MSTHDVYMQRCLQLAKKGIGSARPNPSVGAVIVYQDTIIGEGFTSPYGGSHAEVNAIASVREKDLLKQATLYVTLEPCSHYGKTPPCADLIVKTGIPKVVIGCMDTNSLVSGKGILRLREAGCLVTVGVLEDACKAHHKRFFTVQEKKRPYIILKWAESRDGFIAPLVKEEQKPVWISNIYSRQLAHKWRAKEQAILIGTNTAIDDQPQLNVRDWSGHDPIRVVIDQHLRIPKDNPIYSGKVKTLILTAQEKVSESPFLSFETIKFSKSLPLEICNRLQKHNIQSVLIEGGSQTLQSFIDNNLWDEAFVFTGEPLFKEGVLAPRFNGQLTMEEVVGNDRLQLYTNTDT